MTWKDHARGALGRGEPGSWQLGTAATGRSTVTSVVAVLAAMLVLSLALCAPVSATAAENTAEDRTTGAREHPLSASEDPTTDPERPAEAGPRPFGLRIGAGAGYVPVAKGVNAWEPLLVPQIEARLGRRVVLGTGGLAVRLVEAPTDDDAAEAHGPPKLRVTALLLPNVGRYDEHLPEAYDGMGDVPATAEAGLDVGVRLWKGLAATTRLAADAVGRGHGGAYAALGARWCGVLPQGGLGGGGGSRAGLTWMLGADVVAGTRDYMQAYYGVSQRQEARTSFDSYDASAGLEAVRAQVALALPLGPRVTVTSETTAMLFVGQAGRSPVVRATKQAATQLVVTYRL